MGLIGNVKSVSVVVSYFNPSGNVKLYYQTLHCLACWLANGVGEVVLSDGSGFEHVGLGEAADRLGVRYVWSTEVLGFGAGYNQGIGAVSGSGISYVCLSANDVFVGGDCVEKMLGVFVGHSDTGCVVPYLSHSDLLVQNDWVFPRVRKLDCMTLNVNLFDRQTLVDIGGVPEYLSGAFNDVVVAGALNKLSKGIYLCGAGKIWHHAKSTVGTVSLFNFERDRAVFYERHPDLVYLHRQFYRRRWVRIGLWVEWVWLKKVGSCFIC
jgi:GT2 family glycosyltransferase